MTNFLSHPLPERLQPAFSRGSFIRRKFTGKHDDVTVENIRSGHRKYDRQVRMVRENSDLILMQSVKHPSSIHHVKCATVRIKPSPQRRDVENAKFILRDKRVVDKTNNRLCKDVSKR